MNNFPAFHGYVVDHKRGLLVLPSFKLFVVDGSVRMSPLTTILCTEQVLSQPLQPFGMQGESR